MRVWAVVTLFLFLLLPMLLLGPAAPPAPVQDPVAVQDDGLLPGLPAPRVEADFRDAVYGDLLVVGNSVLRCPDGDADCLAATDNAAPPDAGANNNAYAMRLAAGPDSSWSATSPNVNAARKPFGSKKFVTELSLQIHRFHYGKKIFQVHAPI